MTQAQGLAAGTVERPEVSFGPPAVPESIKVLLADDHPLMLAALRRMLDGDAEIEIVGQAQSAAEVLALAGRRCPDIVLTDLRMPGADGFGLIKSLRASCPDVKVVVLSASDDRASVDGALLAGASAFVVKTASPSNVASVLRQVHNGAVFRAPPAAHPAASAGDASAQPCSCLTDRERTILAAVASGKTAAAIGAELWVSDHTIKFHLTNIYRKVGVPNRAGAVRYAIEHGLVA